MDQRDLCPERIDLPANWTSAALYRQAARRFSFKPGNMVWIGHLVCAGPHTNAVHAGSLRVYQSYESYYYGGGPLSWLEEPANFWLGRDARRGIPGSSTFNSVARQRGAALSTPQP